ncbi:hypothetical protein B0A49_03728 [Cryomyces minteri]|uniref:Arf-GAP domain-containing protein n=1 Tax=Cryomyces minteri TaxID=331657 RepID=A0A4U0XGJ6_9PEZI|nr:hypothetical protein B0A49_03728 [Cryomyces minteri]
MSSALSKRQQARNERTLQDLIKTVPGNDKCADCGARNPGWASWSLGIFLCLRCAALHRKLGTHISKVKSLSMDSWGTEQVDNMKRVGNAASNRLYNPQNAKAAIPIDVDEVDGAMERYIRQKYEHKTFSGGSAPSAIRHNTGSMSTSSGEDRSPPLPPKPTKRFGFSLRAASSTFPRSKADRRSPPRPPDLGSFDDTPSPPRTNKASRVFGSNISTSSDDFETKLAALREMGFHDNRRNSTVLKGMNGNVDRAVESLIRLGEGGKSSSRNEMSAAPTNSAVNGLSIERTRPAKPAVTTNNPFDVLDAPQQQSQQAPAYQPIQTGPAPDTHNPFDVPSRLASSHQPLEQSFQNLYVTPQQQQLFPNNTGGYQTQHLQNNPYHQAIIPPRFRICLSNTAAIPLNPFLRNARSQILASQNPFNPGPQSPTDGAFTNPWQQTQQFAVPQARLSPPMQQQQQNNYSMPNFQQEQQQSQQQQPQPQPQPQQYMQQSQQPSQNPYLQPAPPISTPTYVYQPQQPQPQYYPAPTPRHDKTSILALYDYPHLAPTRPFGAGEPSSSSAAGMPSPGVLSQGMPSPIKQRSVTMPVMGSNVGAGVGVGAPGAQAGSMNPFAANAAAVARNRDISSGGGGGGGGGGVAVGVGAYDGAGDFGAGAGAGASAGPAGGAGGSGSASGVGGRHVSQESADFSGLGSGRHSPDAFAGLSARIVR